MCKHSTLPTVVMLLSSNSLIAAARNAVATEKRHSVSRIQLATSPAVAQELLSALPPALLLVELDNPQAQIAPKMGADAYTTNLLDWLQRQHNQHPTLQSVALSRHSDANTVVNALSAGSSGYILNPPSLCRTALLNSLRASMEQLTKGIPPLSDAVLPHVVQAARQTSSTLARKEEPKSTIVGDPRLSNRENEVLALAAKGFTYAEMARLLNLSVHTISTHTRRIYAKLEVNSRCAAIYEATQQDSQPKSSAA